MTSITENEHSNPDTQDPTPDTRHPPEDAVSSGPVTLPATGAAGRPQPRRQGIRDVKYAFVVPAIAYLFLLGLFPLLFSLYLVFASWQPGSGGITWVGLDNLRRLAEDERFRNALWLTLRYVALVSGVELVLGFVIALALQTPVRGRPFFRLLFALPMLLPPIAISFTWKLIFDYNRGPLNFALDAIGIERVKWLAGSPTSLFALTIVDVWQWTPFVSLAILAALESMPQDLYEAATVDGASAWNLLRHITLPLIQPYVVAIVLLRSIDAFKIFDIVYVLTGGGPGTATEVLTFYAHVAGFKVFNMGFTATIAWAMVLVMTVLFMLYIRAFRRIEEEG